jgi:hypothetical protein
MRHVPADESRPGRAAGERPARATAQRSVGVVGMRLVGLVATAVAMVLITPAVPGFAHAGGGELMYVWWEPADGRDIRGRFTAPADDAAMIGESLGLLRPGAMEAYLGGSEAGYPSEAELVTLSDAPELRTYLTRHILVSQHGVPCDGRVEVEGDFIADGARLHFTCPEPVDAADVRITVLHHADRDYQTFSGDGTLQDALHSVEQPEHRWDFTAAAAEDRAVERPLPLVLGLVLVVAIGAVTVVLLRPSTRGSA